MNFSGKIYLYFIILLSCSTIIALAGIYGFQRLEPAINLLNSCNTQSLYYAEQMFTSISSKKDLKTFEKNLDLAKKMLQNQEKGKFSKVLKRVICRHLQVIVQQKMKLLTR